MFLFDLCMSLVILETPGHWLLFCQIDGEHRTIGYVVGEVLEEVHTALDSGSVLSVEFAWVRYITDWSRSGPGFFAIISIEKRGRWSETAVRYSSTR